ncbi:MAG: oligosaccharide flippase family protein [Clostridia bacterium]|nr:oligosaccharide flippase family protein [Clostridia bacterium]
MVEKKQKDLALGAVILTAFSFLSKFLGMWFRLYLTSRIGSEGIGLYQVIMSVYTLFATFATAGFSVCVSRLAAERMEGNAMTGDSRNALFRCLSLSLIIAVFSMVILLFASEYIAASILADERVGVPISILAISMVFIGPCACLKGYFLAEGKAWKNATAMIFEQLVKISVSVFLFSRVLTDATDPGSLCLGIVWGTTVGEAASFFYCLFIFLFSRRQGSVKKHGATNFRSIIRLIIPLAFGSYVTTLLHTGESVLIPRCFELFGGDRAESLAAFGVIRGMTIPLLFFPFSFVSSFVSLLIPRVTKYRADGNEATLKKVVEKTLSATWVFSIAVSSIFFVFAKEIAVLFYHSEECVSSLRLLALINPMMYVETVSGGILNGIGEQNFTLRCNLYNSVLRITAIATLIPRLGVWGYLMILIVSNAFTFMLCYARILKKIRARVRLFRSVIFPTAISLGVGWLVYFSAHSLGELLSCIIGSCLILIPSILYLGKDDFPFKRKRIDNGT